MHRGAIKSSQSLQPGSLVPRPYARGSASGLELVTQVQILGPTSEFESVQWDRIEAFIRIMQLAKEFDILCTSV